MTKGQTGGIGGTCRHREDSGKKRDREGSQMWNKIDIQSGIKLKATGYTLNK